MRLDDATECFGVFFRGRFLPFQVSSMLGSPTRYWGRRANSTDINTYALTAQPGTTIAQALPSVDNAAHSKLWTVIWLMK